MSFSKNLSFSAERLFQALPCSFPKACTCFFWSISSTILLQQLVSHLQSFCFGQVVLFQGCQDLINDFQVMGAPFLSHLNHKVQRPIFILSLYVGPHITFLSHDPSEPFPRLPFSCGVCKDPGFSKPGFSSRLAFSKAAAGLLHARLLGLLLALGLFQAIPHGFMKPGTWPLQSFHPWRGRCCLTLFQRLFASINLLRALEKWEVGLWNPWKHH